MNQFESEHHFNSTMKKQIHTAMTCTVLSFTLLLSILILFVRSWIFTPQAEVVCKIPTIPAEMRRTNDCAQFAAFSIIGRTEPTPLDVYTQLLAPRQDSGTTLPGIVDAMRPWVSSKYHVRGSKALLRAEIKSGDPVLVVVRIDTPAGSQGHGMVLTGYSRNGWKIQDWNGVKWVSDTKFNALWTGQMIEIL